MTASEIIAVLHDLTSAERMRVIVAAAAMSTDDKPVIDDVLLDVNEAARITGLSESALYHGKWPFMIKVGRRRLFSRAGIRKFIDRNTGKA